MPRKARMLICLQDGRQCRMPADFGQFAMSHLAQAGHRLGQPNASLISAQGLFCSLSKVIILRGQVASFAAGISSEAASAIPRSCAACSR